jgi:hypothetical protein
MQYYCINESAFAAKTNGLRAFCKDPINPANAVWRHLDI